MGWSEGSKVSIGANYYDETSYSRVRATWFHRTWWDSHHWVWIYTNDTGMPVRVTKATFKGCAGHSNGKMFNGGGDGPTLKSDGVGCTFTSDLYVIDASGKAAGSSLGIGSCTVPSISQFNCYYEGYGNVCKDKPKTSFGSVSYFGPKTSYYSAGRCREARTITYDNSPVIPPDGKMFLHIRPISWASSSTNALLVLEGSSGSFEGEVEPEETDYIWVMTNSGWKKEKKSYLMTNTGWEEMKGE